MPVNQFSRAKSSVFRTWSAFLCVFALGSCVVLTSSCENSAAEVVRLKNAADEAYVRGNYSEAESLYQAAAKKAKIRGSRDVTYMICLRSLAQVYVAQRRINEAEAIYKQRVELQGNFPKDSVYASTVYDDLATFYILEGRVAEAKPVYQRAISLAESSYGREDPKVAEKLQYYVQLLRAANHQGEALELEKELGSKKLKIRASIPGEGTTRLFSQ
jgi:tetratricopeptide (TPR) repeat protein